MSKNNNNTNKQEALKNEIEKNEKKQSATKKAAEASAKKSEKAAEKTTEKTTAKSSSKSTRRRVNNVPLEENGEVIDWVDNEDYFYEGPDEFERGEYEDFIEREMIRRMEPEDIYFADKCRQERLLNEAEYRRVIKMWIERVSFAEFVIAIEKRVIGQENVKAVCYNIYHYLELTARGSRKSLPFILAAPSGCGKSETYRAVKDYFKEEMRFLCVGYVDASELTEAGFKGNNPETIVGDLGDKAEANGIGIIFLDEMDKKIIPSYSSSGQNVNAAVQHGLLTIIEGREVTPKGARRSIDTNNTLFIAMGAFDFLRNEKEADTTISIGSKREKREHFSDITREEMLEAGALNELIGRFHTVLNYHKLTEESVHRIVDLNIGELSEEFATTIKAEKNVYDALYKISNGKFGCRTLKNILRDRIQAMDMELKISGKSTENVTMYLDENGDYVVDNNIEQLA